MAALLAGLAARPLAGWSRRWALESAAALFRADLARARAAAILGGGTVAVVLDTTVGSWRIETPEGEILAGRSLERGLLLRSTAHRQRILFTARGTSSLYSTTWIGAVDHPEIPWRGARVSPTGAVERR